MLLLLLVPAAWAPAAAIEPGQALVVAFHVRASLRDAVTVCQEQPLDPIEAASLGEKIAAAISLPGTDTFHKRDEPCLELRFGGPVTTRGSRMERTLRIDAAPLIELGRQLEYRDIFIVVCTPRLTDRITVRRGDAPEAAAGCETGGYRWRAGDALDVDVGVRATGSDLARGVLATASWWLALLTTVSIAAGWFGKRYHWRLLRRYPALGSGLLTLLGVAAAFGWHVIAYQSGLVHTLQFLADVGVAGEVAIVAIPALLSGLSIVAAGMHVSHDAARVFPLYPEQALIDSEAVPAYISMGRRAPRALMWAYAPAMAFALSFIVLWTAPANIEIKVEGMLAASIAFAIAVRVFTAGVLPAIFGAERLPRPLEEAITEDARAAGVRVSQVWSSPVPPAALPLGGAILLAGRRAIVWEPLTGLPPTQLAGGIALRGTRTRGWPLALGGSGLALLTIFVTRTGAVVPTLIVVAAVGGMCALAFIDALERIRVRTAARSGTRAEDHIRGLLAAARAHARLAAGGALTPAEVVLPGLALSTWERAIRLARRIAADAGLEPQAVDRLTHEVVAPENAPDVVAAEATVEPEPEPEPAPKPARRRPAAKKKATAKSRASARSTPRSRP